MKRSMNGMDGYMILLNRNCCHRDNKLPYIWCMCKFTQRMESNESNIFETVRHINILVNMWSDFVLIQRVLIDCASISIERQQYSPISDYISFIPILCENNWVFNFDYCPSSCSICGYHIRLHPMQTHRNRSFPLLAIAGERKNCVKINLNWCNNRFSAKVGKMWQIHRSTTSFCVDNTGDESLYLNLNMLFKQNSKNWVSNLCKCHFIMYAFDSIPTVPKTLAYNCFWKVCHRHACVFCLFTGCASAICVFSMPVIWHNFWLEKLYIRSNRWHMTTCLLQCHVVCSFTCISIIINWLISISNFVQCLITLRSRFFSQSMMFAHLKFGFFNFKTLFSISLFSIVLNDKLFACARAASYGRYLIWQKKIDHRNINRHHHKQFAYDWCTNVWRLDGCHWDGANNLNAMEYWSKR